MSRARYYNNLFNLNIYSSLANFQTYAIATHDRTGEQKTGDRLFEINKGDLYLMREKYGINAICWTTDDGPDGKKHRRLLFEWLFWMVVSVCWGHQVNLVTGDLLGSNKDYSAAISSALAVITWFNNHGEPLGWLKLEQIHVFDGKFWIMFLPVLTRWLAHYHTLVRFIRLRPAIQSLYRRRREDLIAKAGRKPEQQVTAAKILEPINNDAWWDKLETYVCFHMLKHSLICFNSIRNVLEPLAIANNVTQSDGTRFDHVALTLGNLQRIYSNASVPLEAAQPVLQSLEKRWQASDKSVLLITTFGNPYIRHWAFNPAIFSEVKLCDIATRLIRRFFNCDINTQFIKDFSDYYAATGDYSISAMQLEQMKNMYEAEVIEFII